MHKNCELPMHQISTDLARNCKMIKCTTTSEIKISPIASENIAEQRCTVHEFMKAHTYKNGRELAKVESHENCIIKKRYFKHII